MVDKGALSVWRSQVIIQKAWKWTIVGLESLTLPASKIPLLYIMKKKNQQNQNTDKNQRKITLILYIMTVLQYNVMYVDSLFL